MPISVTIKSQPKFPAFGEADPFCSMPEMFPYTVGRPLVLSPSQSRYGFGSSLMRAQSRLSGFSQSMDLAANPTEENNNFVSAVNAALSAWSPVKKFYETGGQRTYQMQYSFNSITFTMPFLYKTGEFQRSDFLGLANSIAPVLNSNRWQYSSYELDKVSVTNETGISLQMDGYSYPILGFPQHPLTLLIAEKNKFIAECNELRTKLTAYVDSEILLTHKECLNQLIRQYNEMQLKFNAYKNLLDIDDIKVPLEKTKQLYMVIKEKLNKQGGKQLLQVSVIPTAVVGRTIFKFFNDADIRKLATVSREWKAVAESVVPKPGSRN